MTKVLIFLFVLCLLAESLGQHSDLAQQRRLPRKNGRKLFCDDLYFVCLGKLEQPRSKICVRSSAEVEDWTLYCVVEKTNTEILEECQWRDPGVVSIKKTLEACSYPNWVRVNQ